MEPSRNLGVQGTAIRSLTRSGVGGGSTGDQEQERESTTSMILREPVPSRWTEEGGPTSSLAQNSHIRQVKKLVRVDTGRRGGGSCWLEQESRRSEEGAL